uniref:Neutrophil cytosolic factor 2 n=1 Tax=Cyprinus carpio carpio TaxID=630221 RepID=A0A9J7ZZ23_CYPCA
MSFVSPLRQWDEAVACVEQRHPDSALGIFLNIEEKSSKIFFYIGSFFVRILMTYFIIAAPKLFPLVEIRAGLLFKPSKNYAAELEKKDYLGKAKVVSSVVPTDEFSGFAPLQPQVSSVVNKSIPEVLRVFDGEPHTVLCESYPETKEELAVLPGNIVFILQKGADNWASVQGLVPYNFLEPLDIVTMTSKPMQVQ